MAFQPGQTILNGKYRITRLIGEGGMARVWLAEEVAFGRRQVAIKEPLPGPSHYELLDLRSRYYREVEVCAALDEAGVPNVVRALTAEPYEDTLLLVMSYMPGGSLADLIRQNPKGLSVERAVEITLAVLHALDGAHEHVLDIVHRDVKPSNILFDGQGRAHLGDFGVAQVGRFSERSRLGAAEHPRTPVYMAPEQGTTTDYLTPAADLYSLGCVLFEMLVGKPYKRMRGTRVRSVRPDVATELDECLAKALQEDPRERWQSAAEMAQALEAALAEAERARQEGEQATLLAQQQAEETARLEVARREAEARAEAEARVQREAAERARQEQEARARREAEELARRQAEAEARARQEAADRARREAQARVQRQVEERSSDWTWTRTMRLFSLLLLWLLSGFLACLGFAGTWRATVVTIVAPQGTAFFAPTVQVAAGLSLVCAVALVVGLQRYKARSQAKTVGWEEAELAERLGAWLLVIPSVWLGFIFALLGASAPASSSTLGWLVGVGVFLIPSVILFAIVRRRRT